MRRRKTPAPPAPAVRSTSRYYTHSDPWALAKTPHPDPLAIDLNRR